ncbi:MAG: flagellar hook basal-body protein [Polyangiales bacterium]
MSDGIYAALSGAVAQQRALAVVANNVANANTTGFRADRTTFQEALQLAGGQGPAPEALRLATVAQVHTTSGAGPLQQTDNPLDFSIQGDGWFEVETKAGSRYTRAGAFVTDAEGYIQNPVGQRLLGWDPSGRPDKAIPLQVPPDTAELRVDPDGTVFALLQTQGGLPDETAIGRIKVLEFGEDAVLRKEGSDLFALEQGKPALAADAQVMQGAVEGANINAVAGLHELITVSRSFEAMQKIIDTFQQIDQRTARDLGTRSS